MAGHSKTNGNQEAALLREIRALRQQIRNAQSKTQHAIDRAVRVADQEIGVGAARPTASESSGRRGPGGRPGQAPYQTVSGQGRFDSAHRPAPAAAVNPYRPASQGARGVPSGYGAGAAGTIAPLYPVPEPAIDPATRDQSSIVNSATFGVAGTPITSGFLLDLGECKSELMGRIAIPIYEQMRRGDAQVRATLAACKLPVQSAKWDVVPAEPRQLNDDRGTMNDERRKQFSDQHSSFSVSSSGAGKQTAAKAKEIAEFVKQNFFGGLEFQSSTGGWVTQSWDEVVRNALLMLDFGCAIHEDVWTVDGDRIRLRRLASRLPLTFYRWHTEADGETLLGIEQYGYRASQFLNVLVPADKICRFTYQQEGANFWGIALQRAMYPHWYVKSSLYRIDGIACERNALGIPVFKLAPGFSKEDKEAAYNWVTQMATHEATGLVEPPGDQFTGLRLVGYEGRLRDVMPSIQHHNVMISRAALALFMDLGQAQHGSRALGQQHGDFFLLSLQNLADQIAYAITRQTVRRLVAFNFGDGAPVPRLIAANVQSRDISELTESLTSFANAGLLISDEDVRAFIREELALPRETKALAGAVAAPKGLTIADENDILSGMEIQGKSAGQVEGQGADRSARAS